ncbi:FadR/GntR family transcriptional regulator [Coralloluteibacterium stylophorae]|uniref:Pyruvate dehydrogenase complex repressor n=2 Tax=Coralloluteibacterium stylophorae TaxID=1776034 RepID=A0AAP2G2C4_9GAMM|nr:FadR/GntR family transcriptional regulator [Coralloluteibacterium stylophorae]MBS7458880.1 FadR family transcriptional regulator [Coralloluteibacterium stylophorae]
MSPASIAAIADPAPPPERAARLVAALEAEIAAGRFGAAQRLPSERALAALHRVSRATVRDAVATLVARGMLVRRRGAGTYVASRDERHAAQVWSDMAMRHPALQGDLIEFRHMLERRATGLAAIRHTEADLPVLRQAFEAVDAAYRGNDRRGQIEADIGFHRAIAGASHNPVFVTLMNSLLTLLHDHIQLSLAGLEPQSEAAAALRVQHRAIHEAIVARDAPRARELAGRHIDFVAVRLNALPRTPLADQF